MPSDNFSVELRIDGQVKSDPEVVIEGFTVREALSQPYEMDLELTFKTSSPDPGDLLEKQISLKMGVQGNQFRFWNGIVAGVTLTQADSDYVTYRVRVVPKLWFLSRSSSCRVFVEQTTMDIVKAVLAEAGITVKGDTGVSDKRPWCAQYRETDLNFISRLLEDAGACYYFEHPAAGQTTMVIANSLSDHDPFEPGGYATIPFGGIGSPGAVNASELITEWTEHQVVASSKYTIADYPFTDARKAESVSTGKAAPHQSTVYGIEDFHAGGEYATNLASVLQQRAQVRIEELQSQRCRKFGQGFVRGIAAGSLFKLSNHPVPGQNVQHLVVSAKHVCSAAGIRSGSSNQLFETSFEATPADLPYRPERVTPKPAVDGLHTAVVTENDASKCGWSGAGPMVQVQFYWDSKNASGWARVAQPNASNSFGTLFLPQIGDEVVVSFLEGDPDRPLVIGSVYNGTNKPFDKYAQSKQPKQTGLRTSSGHELTFDEDAKKVYFESSQDLEVKIAKEEKRDCDTFILTAQTSIELKVGQSSIKIEGSKITITSTAIDIKGNGGDVKISGLNVEASGDIGVKAKGGATAELSGGAQATVKGAMVMIN